MGCVRRKIYCAFGPLPCFICCIKNVRESTTTRICYTMILFSVVVLSIVSHEGGWMEKLYLQFRENLDDLCSKVNAGDRCRRLTGFIGIYRLCFPLFIFHFIMTLLMIGVSSSQTIRGKIHNGFWIWKIVFLMGLYLLAYSFPALETWTKVWMIIGVIGGLTFIYVQHITLIDFAYELNGIWHAKSKKAMRFSVCIYLVALVLYLATAGAYAAFIIFYGLPQQCTLNLTVTGVNAGITALLAVCSVFSNTLRRKQLWLPGAVTSAFVAFLTWSALGSQPRILSSDVPWQRRAVDNMDKKANLTLHPLLVAADHLNRLLSDQFSPQSSPSMIHTPTVQMPTVMINQCLPGGISVLSEHLGKDIFMVAGLLLVIGGSLYSSVRATMQARRMGIRTHRERLKMLLSPIPEHPESGNQSPPTISHPPASPTTTADLTADEGYISKKKIKQQERALNMLAETVAALPNPKVFRRPSARQPSVKHSVRRQRGAPVTPSKDTRDRSGTEDEPLINPPATSPDPYTGSTLRVASSVPDLSSTMRRLSRAAERTDIRDVTWSPLQPASSNQSNGPPPYEDAVLPTDQVVSVNQGKRSKRQRNGTVRPRDVVTSRPRTGRIGDRRVKRTKEEQLALKLARLNPDAFPELNTEPHRRSLIETNLSDQPNGPALLPAKRTSLTQLTSGSPLPDTDNGDAISWSSPGHIRYQRARSVSELVVSPHATRLLESRPNLVASLAYLKPMLNEEAPRDGYVVYNETIASVYSYSWFHLIYALSSLYLMTQLTNWYNPQISRVETLSESWATMWMKLASSWLALLLYAWTIACPRLCIGRKLGDTPFTVRTPRSPASTVTPV